MAPSCTCAWGNICHGMHMGRWSVTVGFVGSIQSQWKAEIPRWVLFGLWYLKESILASHLVWWWAYHTIHSVHLVEFIQKLTASNDFMICSVERSSCRKSWTRKPSQRMKQETPRYHECSINQESNACKKTELHIQGSVSLVLCSAIYSPGEQTCR